MQSPDKAMAAPAQSGNGHQCSLRGKMPITKDNPALAENAGLKSTSRLVASDNENTRPITYEPQEFPSFFRLVTENAAAPIRMAAAYLEICATSAEVHDYDGYVVACDKFLAAGREIAELLKLLKKPSIISNEAADFLERKGRQIHDRAELFELEASHMRSAAAP
jgi:hypothetical protein